MNCFCAALTLQLLAAAAADNSYACAMHDSTFMAGHSHYRRFNVYDGRTAAMESGNYFNTVGWVSYDIPSSTSPLQYNWRMLDASKATLEAAVTVPDGETFLTARGASLREDILGVRVSMGLDEVLGCSPVPVTMTPASSLDMDDERSAWVRCSPSSW